METAMHLTPVAGNQTTDLKSLVDHIIKLVALPGIKRQNLILNKIRPGLHTPADEKMIRLVAGNLLNEVISYTRNDTISVCCNDDGNIYLNLKHSRLVNNSSFAICIETIEIIAQRMGFFVTISNVEEEGTVLTVNFHSLAKVA